MKSIKTVLVILCMIASYATTYAQDKKSTEGNTGTGKAEVKSAVCMISPTPGNKVSGKVTFTLVSGGIKVVADLQGLTKGKHGIHIHEFGDCSSPDGTAAGGHFNPMTKNHGAPTDAMRHEGDMGNIEADESGKAHLDYIDKSISFEGNASIIGKSVIVHMDEDDLKTQPSGNAGARIGCGIIE